MSQLQPIQMDANTIIYVEATDMVTPAVAGTEETGELRRGGQKGGFPTSPATQMAHSFKAIESTIKTYTQYTLNAFRDAALAEVQKVSLEFGVNVSGVGGVPYIASGTVGCNIKVTVECVFPARPPAPPRLGQNGAAAAPPPPPLTNS